jgi:hypothetical protein
LQGGFRPRTETPHPQIRFGRYSQQSTKPLSPRNAVWAGGRMAPQETLSHANNQWINNPLLNFGMNDKDKIKLDLSHKAILFPTEYTAVVNEARAARDRLIEELGFRFVKEYDELMIPDVTLAKVLGYKHPRSIRRFIMRHIQALTMDGSLRSFIEEKRGPGRKREGFLLTMQQALFLMAKSDNPVTEEITVLLVSSAFHRLPGGISPANPDTVRELEKKRDNYRGAVDALRECF